MAGRKRDGGEGERSNSVTSDHPKKRAVVNVIILVVVIRHHTLLFSSVIPPLILLSYPKSVEMIKQALVLLNSRTK
jgi:hypothetical protein